MQDENKEIIKLRIALLESLKLQSHYAKLLNQYDGGQRRIFCSIMEWMKRLEELDNGGEKEQVMIKVEGKAFRCDCGCNVFTHIDPEKDVFRCNVCEQDYRGEKQ